MLLIFGKWKKNIYKRVERKNAAIPLIGIAAFRPYGFMYIPELPGGSLDPVLFIMIVP